jgi:hypothetical protein
MTIKTLVMIALITNTTVNAGAMKILIVGSGGREHALAV